MDDSKPDKAAPKATPVTDEALDQAAGGTTPAPPKRKTEQARQTTLIQDV